MQKGQFTLRDLYQRLSSAMKMGPMNKVMGMIPGMGEMAQVSSGLRHRVAKALPPAICVHPLPLVCMYHFLVSQLLSLPFCRISPNPPAFDQMAGNSVMQQQFKRNLYMMDSMTDDELDGKVRRASDGCDDTGRLGLIV